MIVKDKDKAGLNARLYLWVKNGFYGTTIRLCEAVPVFVFKRQKYTPL